MKNSFLALMVICFVKTVIYYAPDHYFENKIISMGSGNVTTV